MTDLLQKRAPNSNWHVSTAVPTKKHVRALQRVLGCAGGVCSPLCCFLSVARPAEIVLLLSEDCLFIVTGY